jgi:hypothetical protein
MRVSLSGSRRAKPTGKYGVAINDERDVPFGVKTADPGNQVAQLVRFGLEPQSLFLIVAEHAKMVLSERLKIEWAQLASYTQGSHDLAWLKPPVCD